MLKCAGLANKCAFGEMSNTQGDFQRAAVFRNVLRSFRLRLGRYAKREGRSAPFETAKLNAARKGKRGTFCSNLRRCFLEDHNREAALAGKETERNGL
ncbi:hypothetical protein C5Y97_22855 [Blastopirellula marina]|uniref:Uncharacterized protein n=1 Tax=Blastopirellula marina TaxID=124 RepID=A0A2S8FA48_9BACT|nr:hypothetical protein C5Y98_22845 [Blastopirellula marina]PTL42318.1 hypothetical protein C5Y97_22855 [Blastopirellula marina]